MNLNEEIQAKILTVVASRFVTLREATDRKSLIVEFEDSAALQDLVQRSILRRKDSLPEEYLPTAMTFEFCDDRQLRDAAKLGTTVVLHALRNIYRVEKDRDFAFSDLLEHVHRIYPNRVCEDDTLALGLYLAQDMGVLRVYQRNEPKNTEIISFRVAESAVTRRNLDAVWDEVTGAYKRLQESPHATVLDAPKRIRKNPKPKENQVFLPAGSQHDAYVRLRRIVKTTKQEILIVDAYVDQTLWALLSNLSPEVRIRILTNRMQGDFRLESQKFVAQHGNSVTVRRTPNYHDRFIIADGRRCWHIGASIKDAGNKAFALSELLRPQVVKTAIADVETEWSGAAAVSL